MSTSPTQLLLSLSTGAVLAGFWCGRMIATTIEALGEASEATFKGDQLPLLKVEAPGPTVNDATDATDATESRVSHP